MNEPNYEAIGRCVVLRRQMDEYINQIIKVKSSILAAESPHLSGDLLVIDYSLVGRIEEASVTIRTAVDHLERSIAEHNKHAQLAALPPLSIEVLNYASTNPPRLP